MVIVTVSRDLLTRGWEIVGSIISQVIERRLGY
jgi:hypothetical protein